MADRPPLSRLCGARVSLPQHNFDFYRLLAALTCLRSTHDACDSLCAAWGERLRFLVDFKSYRSPRHYMIRPPERSDAGKGDPNGELFLGVCSRTLSSRDL